MFSNAHADQFPHEANADGDVVPSFMEKLLSTGFHNFILAPGDKATCEEVCYTSWHLEIRCVCVSFVHEMSEMGVTHNTKPFVTDFPINLWLFENLSNTQAKSLVPQSGTFKPKFHAVVNIPSTISAAINHLELLFLMRLGDSLNNFQLMMEEIFTFKSTTENTADPNKPTESQSVIAARKKRQITDADFEFTGCVLVKSFHFIAYLPAKRNTTNNLPPNSDAEDTPTHLAKCQVLLRRPTIDESEVRNLPHGEPLASQHVATITGPISVSPDPGLHHALQRSLPGTPRLLTPRSQSPSLESVSTDTSTTLSHSDSLASMNIDDAVNQFSGYQEDDFYVIETKDNHNTTSPIENPSVTSQFSAQDNVEQKLQEHVSQVPSQFTSQQTVPDYDTYTQPAVDGSSTGNSELLQLPTVNLQNQVTIEKDMMPESSVVVENDQQVQISINNSTEILPNVSSATLENEENATLTLTNLNGTVLEGHSSTVPPEEEIHWQLQLAAFNISAIPIVNPTGLIAKLSVGRVDLKEEPINSHSASTETLSHKDVKLDDVDEDYDLQPSIRGRIELGPRIYKYYPTLEELHIPCVVQLHVNGVNASLLLSLMENLALMFEDEIKSAIPVPLYIMLEGNQFVMLNSPGGHAEDFTTLSLSINKLCIQRGPEVPKLAIWKAEHLGGKMAAAAAYKEATPVAEVTNSSTTTNMKSKELDTLLSSIKTFTSSLQPQVEKLAGLSQVQSINQALLELQNVVGVSEHFDPPPRYSESIDHDNISATVASLHKEIDSLKQEQRRLQDEIKHNWEQIQVKDSEMSQLVGELVKSKDSEVAMKEVVFRLNNQIQDVVMENDQLKVMMARAGLRVPVGKKP